MQVWKELVCFTGMALLLACGGGGGGAPTVPPSLSVSTNEITWSSTTNSGYSPTTLVDLSFANIPPEGLYYGYASTSSGIESISDWQFDDHTIRLQVRFKAGMTLGAGTYLDEIIVGAATDPSGANQIANSPQLIRATYTVQHPPSAIVSLNPTSAYAGGPAFTLSLSGRSYPGDAPFPADAQVFWNGEPVATTFVSPTSLQATIPAQLIAAAGTAQITVGGPDSIPSDAIAFPVANSQARYLPFGVNDIAWDEVHQVVYASQGFKDYSSGPYPNSIVVIDPFKGEVKSVVPIDCQIGPLQLAISKDCSFLYASVPRVDDQHFGAVHRYFLPSLAVDPSFSIDLGLDPTGTKMCSLNAMEVDPGNPYTLGIGRGINLGVGGLAIFDNGVQRGGSAFEQPGTRRIFSSLQWGTGGSTLYASGSNYVDRVYASLTVSQSGLGVQTETLSVQRDEGHDIHWVPSEGKIFVGNGQVLDPASGQVLRSFGTGFGSMLPDPALGIAFFVDQQYLQNNGRSSLSLRSFDLAQGTPIASTLVPFFNIGYTPGPRPGKLLRCGNVLVMNGGDGGLWILSGPFAEGH
jgi:hypothetical protein